MTHPHDVGPAAGPAGPTDPAVAREVDDAMAREVDRAVHRTVHAATRADGPAPDQPDESGAAPGERPEPLLFDLGEALGGRRGVVDAALPGFVLVVVNVAASLGWAVVAAVATSVAIGAVRLWRKEPLRQAASGVIGIAFAALLAAYTGDAKNFFLPGILINGAYVIAMLASIAARRPVLGYVAAALDKRFVGWRDDRALVRRADYATLVWTAVFAVRFVLQGWLYLHDHVGWLATARLAMGWPLWGLAVMASLLLLQPSEDRGEPATDGPRAA